MPLGDSPNGLVYQENWRPEETYQLFVDGKAIVINAKYDLLNYNLSDAAIARINAFGKVGNNDAGLSTLYLYGGNATNANDLDKLSGSFTYKGNAILGSDTADFSLNADFSQKTISGTIGNTSGIQLMETPINTDSGYLTFKGTANSFGNNSTFQNYSGSYEGKFMGSQAKQVAGAVSLIHKANPQSTLGAVFIGEQNKH